MPFNLDQIIQMLATLFADAAAALRASYPPAAHDAGIPPEVAKFASDLETAAQGLALLPKNDPPA